jgi:NACalpha-BTF3-like transcription factor
MFDFFNHFKDAEQTPETVVPTTEETQYDQNDPQLAELAKFYNIGTPAHQSVILDEEKQDLSSVPYQQRADYQAEQLVPGEQSGIPDIQRDNGSKVQKASYKNSTVSKLMGQLGTVLPQAAADEMPAPMPTPEVAPQSPAVDPMALRQAQLDAAQADQRDRLADGVLRGASTDALNAALMGWGVKERLTPGYADQRLNEKAGLQLKDLEGQMKLAGQVGAEEEAKINLNNQAQMSDPNSQASQLYKQTVVELYGLDPKSIEGASAQQLMSTYGEKLGNMIKDKAEQKLRQAQIDAAAESARNSREDRKMAMEDRKVANEEKAALKVAETDNKDALKLQETLDKGWVARSGQAGAVQSKIIAAEAAEQLIDQGRMQPGGLDSRQIEELAQATARLLGGTTAASHRVEALVPKTAEGRARTLQEFITGKPTGQEMQAFTDRMAETVKREKDLANDQRRQFQIESLAAHSRLRKNNPELYNEVLKAKGINPEMITEDGRYKKPESTKSYSAQQEQGIKNVMNAHPGVSREEVIKALQKAGKI